MILKKLYTCFFCLLFLGASFSIGWAQDCSYYNILIVSQQEIDDFAIFYPNCDQIEGQLRIHSLDLLNEITNLNGLSHIKSVGSLIIDDNYKLTEIGGLTALQNVKGQVIISQNPLLTSLDGLESLQAIEGDFTIYNNDRLENLDGLDKLSYIDGDLLISSNLTLSSLDGIETLQHVNTDLVITINPNLENLDGLIGLKVISNDLIIQYCYNLENLNGLKSLQTISSNLDINHLDNLSSLNSFDALEFIGGDINIEFNNKLTDLSGFACLSLIGTESMIIRWNNKLESLEGIEHLNLRNLSLLAIAGNTKLKVCAVQSICEYISEGKTLYISSPHESCRDVQTIIDACQNVPVKELTCEGLPFPNPTNDFLLLNCTCDYNNVIKYKIFDINGRLMTNGSFNNQPINVSQLIEGTYFIKFEDSNEIDLSFSFVKM